MIDFHSSASPDAWRWAAAVAITSALRRRLDEAPRARLLVSGGSTPAPVFESLSQAPLAWDRVDIGLVDERWLAPGDPDTNASLVREHLLKGRAASARFEDPHLAGEILGDAVARANARAAEPPAVIVLGMGGDGHTASLFPGMHGLDAALASDAAYIPVNASGCEGAGPWPTRLSLTPAGMSGAALRLLLLRGEDKRIVFEHARSGVNAREMPVRAAFELPGTPLQVYWTR